jgi:FAD-dependent oxidoreductase domain-containing protein 1
MHMSQQCRRWFGTTTGSTAPLRVAIIGGGAMGSSSAFWLTKRAQQTGRPVQVSVIEKDLQFKKASTALSVGSIRQQFSIKENIQMSLFGAEFLKNMGAFGVQGEDCVQFFEGGYLFLASAKGAPVLTRNTRLQQSLGAHIALLTPDDLAERFPWLSLDGIALGSLGLTNEGWFDPWQLLCTLKSQAQRQGATYVNASVVGMTTNGKRVTGTLRALTPFVRSSCYYIYVCA